MSNTQRPSLAPKHTTKTEKNRAEANDQGIKITVDGATYTVREADMTSLDVSALRREVGLTWVGLTQALTASPDVDLIAALVWLARRQGGEQMLSFHSVASEITYESDIDVADAEPESDPQT